MSVELRILNSRVARRLLALFALGAILPFVLASAAALHELRALSARSDAARLHALGKGYGMELAGRLGLADVLLRTRLEHDVASRSSDAPPSGPELLTGRVVTIDATRSADVRGWRRPETAGWDVSPGEASSLRSGRALLRFVNVPDSSLTSLWLARKSADAGAIVWAEVSVPALLEGIVEYGGASRLAVLVDGERVIGHSTAKLPAALLRAVGSGAADGKGAAQTARSRGARILELDTAAGRVRAAVWSHPIGSGYGSADVLQIVAWEPLPTIWQQIGSLQLVFPALMIGAVLLAVGLASTQLRRQLQPLGVLTAATRRIAAREFDAQVAIRSGDEFEELGNAFNSMASALKREFETVEAMAQVDRLLLESRGLETVLDTLLPRTCRVASCYSATVLLFDREATGRARAYDFVMGMTEAMPVRRVSVDAAELQARFGEQRSLSVAGAALDGPFQFLSAIAECGTERFELQPLRRDDSFAGLLCLGYAPGPSGAPGGAVEHHRGLADRISVALTNLSHGESLYREANYDALTGLPNRRLFHQRVGEALLDARQRSHRGGVMFVDLDHFKRVNDTVGHGVGDEILRRAGERIVSCCGRLDTAARLGGDEFAVLVPQFADEDALAGLADRILAAMSEPIKVGRREHLLGASIGIAVFPTGEEDVGDLLKHADIAMYRAKEAGRNRAMFFEADMNARMQGRVEIESGLHRALREAAFELRYQPIVTAEEQRLAGAEALLRWPGAPAGVNGPTQFISIAEETGLIVDIGEWALNHALDAMLAWERAGVPVGYVSVNVSPRQLSESRFLARVEAAFANRLVNPNRVMFEITESVLADIETARPALLGLARLGARIAIDDFGTGYSSLGYLRELPIDAVKIDRSFITAVPLDNSACKLVDTIVAMGHALEKSVIAEGVETQAQLDYLRLKGCDAAQGYLFSAAMSARDFAEWAMRYVRNAPRIEPRSATAS